MKMLMEQLFKYTVKESWDNFGKISYFPPKLSHFLLKMGKLLAHLERKKWEISGKIQDFPELFSRFFPVYDTDIDNVRGNGWDITLASTTKHNPAPIKKFPICFSAYIYIVLYTPNIQL